MAAPDAGSARRSGRLIRVVLVAVLLVVCLQIVHAVAFRVYFVPSASMEPTLCGGADCRHGNDHILVNRISFRLHPVHRGDIVVFSRPPALDKTITEKSVVKRVVAVAGDKVRWAGPVLWINDKVQHETYVNPACAALAPDWSGATVLGANQVFVMGDNRCNSDDSRIFGPISTGTIIGRVTAIVWPISRATSF
ncbi:signal peptidase I [Jatrophihabitans sp. GAS493]|uniref:signal peptidase I n=1 Tax=Jatrophihabitans sp. GAS493 TaxID=1907575 RepID=UPI000BB7F3DA|nr:signal peptidase I [Jatrophihabitans sp. GAS493]SOD74458.1 signal peptidase I [Jatrophihabitans sp. GAS493]